MRNLFIKTKLGLILRPIARHISFFIPVRKLRRKVRDKINWVESPSWLIKYFSKTYIPRLKNMEIKKEKVTNEHLFQVWLQGEESAPNLVAKCFESVKRFAKDKKRIVITKDNVKDWVELPDYIIEKHEKGIISNAHFADILRLCLLSEYGGYWVDATCLLSDKFPDWLEKEDFFMFHVDEGGPFLYTLIQNCFIRSNVHNYLVDAWKFLMFEYWREENRALNYFFAHFLFIAMIETDEKAKEEYNKMPNVSQFETHEIIAHYYKKFDEKEYEKFINGSFMHKLSWKIKTKKKYRREKQSYVQYLLDNDLDHILKCSPK